MTPRIQSFSSPTKRNFPCTFGRHALNVSSRIGETSATACTASLLSTSSIRCLLLYCARSHTAVYQSSLRLLYESLSVLLLVPWKLGLHPYRRWHSQCQAVAMMVDKSV